MFPSSSVRQSSWLRISAIAWLGYFFTGALISTLGIILFPLSKAFGRSPAFIGQVFTLMNIGLFIPIVISGVLIRRGRLATLLSVGAAVSALMCAMLFVFPGNIAVFGCGVFLIGAASGIMMAIGSYLVVRINDDPASRSANLIFTDFFFALPGVIMTILLGYLFKEGVSWLAMYGVMGILSLLMIALCAGARLPAAQAEPRAADGLPGRHRGESWGIAAWVLCFSLLFFLLAEPVFTMWLPTWLRERFALAPDDAAYYVTTYWILKSIGLFANQFTVRFVRIRTYLLTSTIVGMIALLVAANSGSPKLILICAGLFGFCNSGIFSGMVSYGSLQVRNPPPTLTAALLTIGTIGTLIFASLSSFVSDTFGTHWALNTSTLAYAALLISLLLACVTSRAEKLNAGPGVPAMH